MNWVVSVRALGFLAFLVLLICFSGSVGAQDVPQPGRPSITTAGDWARGCAAGQHEEFACEFAGIVYGLYGDVRWCVPGGQMTSGGGRLPADAHRAVINWLSQRPDLASLKPSQGIGRALDALYPCPGSPT